MFFFDDNSKSTNTPHTPLTILWCSLVEPTPCVTRRSPWQQFPPPRKNCHDFSLAWSGARSAPLPARPKPWQFLRGGENRCYGNRLGTQASVQLANTTKKKQKNIFRLRPQTDFIRLVSSKLVLQGGSRPPGRLF